MFFTDRREAGRLLAEQLIRYRDASNTLLLALPRGGVPVAFEVALLLNLPLDVTCPHKLGAPGNPELAIGAITESGEGIYSDALIKRLGVSEEYLREEVATQTRRAQEKLKAYRPGKAPLELSGKRVILIDDGLATGSTMKAAIISVKKGGAGEIIVAIPVSPPETLRELKPLVDALICLSAPAAFAAVGQFYGDFSQVSDEEVMQLLARV